MSTVRYDGDRFASVVDAAGAGAATWEGVCPVCGQTHTLTIRSAVPTEEGNLDVQTDPCPTPMQHVLRRKIGRGDGT
jgi:hypothetical protein